MRKVIFLSGLSIALFTAGLIFFANSGSKNASATETAVNPVNDKANSCQCSSGASCGCSAEKGTCTCANKSADGTCGCAGKSTAGVCGAVSANSNSNTAVNTPKNPSCGCQKTAPVASDLK